MLVYLRSAIFTVGYFFSTVTYGTLSLLARPLPRAPRHRFITSWAILIIQWMRLTCGVRYHVIGKQNLIGLQGPIVVLAKHQSSWETLFLQSLFSPCATILKRELLKIPFFGWGLAALNPIAIDRSSPRAALKQVKSEGLQRLEQQMNMLIFPEGTRMPPGKKGKYAASGADIAISAGVPVVPVAVNAGHCWPSGSFRKYPGLISVIIGPPIQGGDKTARELTNAAETWIETEMAKL